MFTTSNGWWYYTCKITKSEVITSYVECYKLTKYSLFISIRYVNAKTHSLTDLEEVLGAAK